jgi:pSer/pThr/pTyr-binding forkhead associated (FHA) protein
MTPKSFQLIMRSGPNPGQTFELDKDVIIIGRDVINDIVIGDIEISRRHARLTLQAGSYVLEDLGSTNGTYADGQRLMGPHVLRPGELIMLGENVALVLDEKYDTSATLVSAPVQAPVAAAEPKIATAQPVMQRPAPVFREPEQRGAFQSYPEMPAPEAKKSNRTLIFVIIAILIVLLCLVVAGFFVFDYLDLYCTPPFNNIFYCP